MINIICANSFKFLNLQCLNGENAWWVATQMGHVDVEMIFKHYGKWIPKAENNGYKFAGSY